MRESNSHESICESTSQSSNELDSCINSRTRADLCITLCTLAHHYTASQHPRVILTGLQARHAHHSHRPLFHRGISFYQEMRMLSDSGV
mmetsp:Transcript_33092/g.48335  ORF Transcript_33092/g.48335 Transcript_33092/m.48335 type:complete len:89 (+) Transcript_33092:1290-1556(+)